MDLERLLVEPPVGEVESEAGRPLDLQVRSVIDSSLASQPDEDNVLSALEELSSVVGDGFMEGMSDEELDDLVSSLVDVQQVSLDHYNSSMLRVRSEIASTLLRSLIKDTERLTGEPFKPPVASYYSRLFEHWNWQWASIIREVLQEGLRSFHGAFQDLLSGGSVVNTEPVLEGRVRDLESRRSELEDKLYRRGYGIGRRLPERAMELVRVCDTLIDFFQVVINGLDLLIAITAVRVLSGFKGWREQLRQRVESTIRNQIADLIGLFGRQVVNPLFYRLSGLREVRDTFVDLLGEIEELEFMDELLDQIQDWWQRYNRFVHSIRDDMRRSFRFGTELSVNAKQYDVLYRRRRLCVALKGIVSAFRSGLLNGMSDARR
jgi:hypothetical protein